MFQQPFLQLLLACDAMPRPRHGFQPLWVDLRAARDALAEGAFPDPVEGAIYHLQELSFVVALMKQKFLVVRVGSPIGDVLCRLHIGLAPILSSASHGLPQFPLAFLQALLENFQLLLVHRFYPADPSARNPSPPGPKLGARNRNDMRGRTPRQLRPLVGDVKLLV